MQRLFFRRRFCFLAASALSQHQDLAVGQQCSRDESEKSGEMLAAILKIIVRLTRAGESSCCSPHPGIQPDLFRSFTVQLRTACSPHAGAGIRGFQVPFRRMDRMRHRKRTAIVHTLDPTGSITLGIRVAP